MTGELKIFFKKWRMRIWYASIFLSLLAGKLPQIEQSAGVTQVMEIFERKKKKNTDLKEAANIKPAHVQKVQSET